MNLRLREIRKSLSMTQKELADRSGVSRTTVNCIENQNGYVTSTDVLEKIAHALGVTIPELFGGSTIKVQLSGKLTLEENGRPYLGESFSNTEELICLLNRYADKAECVDIRVEEKIMRLRSGSNGDGA